MDAGWVDHSENDTVSVLVEVAVEIPSALTMPFLQSWDRHDAGILHSLLGYLRSPAGEYVKQTLSDPELSGGITNENAQTTLALLALGGRDSELAETLRALPWALPWVQDGVGGAQQEPLRLLATVALSAPSVLNMPFLQQWDTLDIAALQALAALSRPEARLHLEQVLAHPSLAGGITDAHTHLIASIGMIGSRPDLIEVMLDPQRTHIEERALTLPIRGVVRLSVIWPGKTASEVADSRSMELLEQALRSHEGFMGVAFPLDYAILVDADARRFPGAHGIAGIIASPWIEDRGLIFHEMAHTYWRDETPWLNEGGASWLDVVAHRDYDGTPLPDAELPCEPFDNLYDLEHSDAGFDVIFGSGCPYFLGRGIFRELYEGLGDEAARRGYGRLYLALRDDSYDDVCAGDDRNGCYVQEAFLEGATPEQAAIVDDIIARRYYGPNRTPAPG